MLVLHPTITPFLRRVPRLLPRVCLPGARDRVECQRPAADRRPKIRDGALPVRSVCVYLVASAYMTRTPMHANCCRPPGCLSPSLPLFLTRSREMVNTSSDSVRE